MHEFELESHYVTRVEGHGHIKVKVAQDRIEEVRFEIPEAARFFEAIFQGRPYPEISLLASRICGICAVAHSSASLRATEAALGITPSPQTVLFRKLNLAGEMIQSHILHIYFLVAPDLFGVGSVIPLAQSHPEVVRRAIRMRKVGDDLCIMIGGRHIHPISAIPGGYYKLPAIKTLQGIRQSLEESFTDLDATVELIQGATLPDFSFPSEYLSLSHPEEYGIYDGEILSSKSGPTPEAGYRNKITEKVVSHSTAKHVNTEFGPYMVGALARFNNNYEMLSRRAKEAAGKLGLTPPCHNPFMNTVAQLVETWHFTEWAIELIDELCLRGITQEELHYQTSSGQGMGLSQEAFPGAAGKDKPPYQITPGQGVGLVEAPRGSLFHDYTYNAQGLITDANCIIPTNQNLAHIEAAMRDFLPQIWDEEQPRITGALEMLVRAYDPCISCSTHLVEVEFIK